jgi:O-acetyl-ADP-ribose deacetylase (regulator of RNase III)
MGKGLALAFKQKFRETTMLSKYKKTCESGTLKPGMILPYPIERIYPSGYSRRELILHCATKDKYKDPSELKWIESILIKFQENIPKMRISSVAFPKLGCGLGGLSWDEVGPLMQKYLQEIPIKVYIYIKSGDIEY